MNSTEPTEEDMLRCVAQGTLHLAAHVAWLLSASASFPARSFNFSIASTDMDFCFVLDKIQSSGHYSLSLELCTMPQLIAAIEVRANVVVSTVDGTRRLGNQSFKGDFDRENTRFVIPNILLGKTAAQEPSFIFEADCYITKTATRSDIPWEEDPAVADVVILSSDGSPPVLVKESTVLRALPSIMDIVTINASVDESNIDHHPPSQSSSSPDSNNGHQTQQASISTPSSSPSDHCLVDLSESTVNAAAVFSPSSRTNEDDDEALLIGEPIQDRPQPAVNRKTRRKQQKRTKLHHHDDAAASSVSEEGMSLQMADGSTSAQSPSSSTASSLLLSERFSDTMSSEPSTPKPSPAVPNSPIHKNANKGPLPEFARDGRKVWIWPQDLPDSSCANIMRWVYVGVTPKTPLQDFNDMFGLLHRLAHPTLLQAFVMEQRRAIEQHASPLDLIAATDYNVGPAKVLLRPVLLAAIKKRWSSTSTTTALAKMLTEDRSGVLLEFIQSLPVPQC
ncbi:hypothetical protein BGZ68_000315 [Mortierella alpina]|nr:hypothetical protein BGZ68_000315 [Mortierella alpina]